MPDAVRALVAAVRDRLPAAADPGKAAPMQAYMRSAMPYHGVSAQPLGRLMRGVLADHLLPDRASWERSVRTLWDEATHREERYAALAVAGDRRYLAHRDPATLPLWEHLVVSGAWWDLVDPVATRRVGEVLAGHREPTTPVVRAWSTDEDLWLRRTAVLAQLHHGADTDRRLLADVLVANLEGSRHGSEFFVRKAVGWALRQHARVDPDWVRAFVAEHDDRLAGLSRREALRHLGTGTATSLGR